MKTNLTRSCLAVILPLGLAMSVFAQDAESRRKASEAQLTMMRSPVLSQMEKNTMKQEMYSYWNGDGSNRMAFNMLYEDDFREGLGISKEQPQKILDEIKIHFPPLDYRDIKPSQDELSQLLVEAENGSSDSEETNRKYVDLQSQMLQLKASTQMLEQTQKPIINAINVNLTSDQLKKFKEFQISAMSELPYVSPGMFEALDLSGAQKKQLDEIKMEMEAEFEKQVDKKIDVTFHFHEKLHERVAKLDGEIDLEKWASIVKDVLESNPKLQREMKEMEESDKAFVNRLKFLMFDVLTDEQMERMAQLIDNPPDYVKKAISQIRKRRGNSDSQTTTAGEWKPGPDSWKPGDGIPEGYMKHREEQRRFPRRK